MKTLFWNIVYKIYPPFLRVLEVFRVHNKRQNYLVGTLNGDLKKLRIFLKSKGYEDAILAWKDPGEVLSMRKIDSQVFQYHIRVFIDGEVRCHYEYSSEGNPWGHVTEKYFEPRTKYFSTLLKEFI